MRVFHNLQKAWWFYILPCIKIASNKGVTFTDNINDEVIYCKGNAIIIEFGWILWEYTLNIWTSVKQREF